MREFHPFQKHFCLLFLSLAVLTTYVSLKNKHHPTSLIAANNETLLNISLSDFEDEFYFGNEEEMFLGHMNFSAAEMWRTEEQSNVIHILGLFELTTKWGRREEGESEMIAAQLAVDHINSLNILPGYTLNLLVNDTQCDPGVGIDRFFHAIYSKKRILMLLGSGCSNVTERLALVVPYWNIIQISFGSTSPALSDRNKFPFFFRTVAPDSSHNDAKIHFVKEFGWRVVATFSQSENQYLFPINSLVKDLEKANVSCISTITFSVDNYMDQLKLLKDLNVRIIIGSFSNQMLPKVLCAIFQTGMSDGDYVWILQNREGMQWHSAKGCSTAQLNKAAEGLILVSDFNNVYGNEFPTSGMTSEEFELALNVSKISKYAKQTYDALWAIVLTLSKGSDHDWLDSIESFQYAREDIVCRWMQKMSELKFVGLSGPLKFKGADRIGNSVFRQIQSGELKDIALFDSISNTLDFHCKTCHPIHWKNGQVPLAQRILRLKLTTVPSALFYTVALISCLGIGCSFLFLYFNLHFRRLKSLKLSSPKINNVAVVGCILVYSSAILLGLNNTKIKPRQYFSEICTARVYLLSAGFSLTFGSMLAKTYRIHRLFTYLGAGLVRDKFLKDNQLIALILIPLIIDGLILILWVMMDPMERHIHNLTLESNLREPGLAYQPQIELCSSHNTEGWYVALFGYKSIILIMGVYMAWRTRHIKVPALNDSQHIGICVYSAVFTTIIVILSSFISNYLIFTYLAKTICILASTTLTLLLLFLPKLKLAFRRIECEDSVTQSMGLKTESNTRRFITDDTKEMIYRLEVQNKVYRCEVAALDKEISRLEELLHSTTTCSTRSSVNVITTAAECYLSVPNSSMPRASWPCSQGQLNVSRKRFRSENKLSNDLFEKIKFLGKLKKYFTSFSTLYSSNQQTSQCEDQDLFKISKKLKPTSTPDVYKLLEEPATIGFVKAKSDLNIRKPDRNLDM